MNSAKLIVTVLMSWKVNLSTTSLAEFNMSTLYIFADQATFAVLCSSCRGTQPEILRKRPKYNNKAWIQLSETILSILGDCWEKFICSSLPGRLMGEFPASKVHLQSITCLTDVFRHYWPVWVWSYGRIQPVAGGSGGAWIFRKLGVAKGRKPSLKWKNRYLEEQIHWVPPSMSIYFIGWGLRSIS